MKKWLLMAWRWLTRAGEKPVDVKPRRPKLDAPKPLWPNIVRHIELWEEAHRDRRVDWKALGHGNPHAILKTLYGRIPLWGAYDCSDDMTVHKSMLDDPRVDTAIALPQHACWAIINEDTEGGRAADNMLQNGVFVISISVSDELPTDTYALDAGTLYEVMCTHWDRKHGHGAIHDYVIINQAGEIKPTWKYMAHHVGTSRKNRGDHRPPSTSRRAFRPTTNTKDLARIAGAFAFYRERDFHWNCIVKSFGVPPLCFPVTDHDIARVFPANQRDGDGRIVHWTRTHKRRTKRGEVFVRTHIRGNSNWEIDGRNVSITMPGKHHGQSITQESCITNSAGEIVRDPVTGLTYFGAKPSKLMALFRRAQVSVEKIEITEAA